MSLGSDSMLQTFLETLSESIRRPLTENIQRPQINTTSKYLTESFKPAKVTQGLLPGETLPTIPSDITVEPVPSDGSNFTSSIYLANISSLNENLNLFVKVAKLGEKMRKEIHGDWMYSTERFTYTKLFNVYEKLQDQYDIPKENRFLCPKFYGSNPVKGEEIIVLENLTAIGYSSLDRLSCLDWEQASSAVTALARFHALSIVFEQKYPEEYKEAAKVLVFQKDEDDDRVKVTWQKMMESALDVVENEEYRERAYRALMKGGPSPDQFQQFHTPPSKGVLVHGDYRPCNLLFKKVDGNRVYTVPVDFQTVHVASPGVDLIYLIYMGTDANFRAKYQKELLDCYHSQLAATLQRFGIDVETVYSKEMFLADMNQLLRHILLLGVVVLPIVCVAPSIAPQISSDADTSCFIVAPNQLFVQRFNEVVKECVDSGFI